MTTLAIDLGGTWLRGALLHDDGALEALERHRLRSVFDGRTSDEVWNDVVDLIASYSRSRRRAVSRVAIAFPGPISRGRALAAPTLTSSARVPANLLSRLRRGTSLPVGIVNDVAAATAFLCADRGDRSFFLVAIGSGIGSRVRQRGASAGVASYEGEIGHLTVDTSDAAPPCDCGGSGHLGALSSGRAVERRAREAAARDGLRYSASVCGRSGVRPCDLTNEAHLVPAMLAGDKWSLGVLRASAAPLAKLILQVVVAGGLERCYLLGGFATALGSVYRDALVSAMEELLDSPAVAIDPAAVVHVVAPGAEAVLRGAVLAT